MNRAKPAWEHSISGPFRIGEWSVDPALDEISRHGETVKLEPRTMRLLCRLAQSAGDVVGSQQLLDDVWPGVVVGPASVYQAISALRKTLGDFEAEPRYIATVARRGYRLIAKVERETPVAGSDLPVVRARRSKIVSGAVAGIVVLVAAIVLIGQHREPAPGRAAAVIATSSPNSRQTAASHSLIIMPLRPATPGESDDLFAAVATDLLRNRLMTQKDLRVVSTESIPLAQIDRDDVRELAARVRADRVLRGTAGRNGERLRMDLTLLDAATGTGIWSGRYEGTATEITALREQAARELGPPLQIQIGYVANPPVQLQAYELYMRGLREYRKYTRDGFIASHDIFQRTTMLYPEFARGYFGLAVALRQMYYFPESQNSQAAARYEDAIRKALDRALDLDPHLAEAVIDRAEVTADPAAAENLFRRGMQELPSYSIGSYKYGIFLSRRGRSAEGLVAFDEALRIDPLSAPLMAAKANILLLVRGDVAGHDALMRELIANHPETSGAESALGSSLNTWSGQTAEALTHLEREIARDPSNQSSRIAAAAAYLDVDDPAAAVSAAKGAPLAQLQVAQYLHEPPPFIPLQDDYRSWKWPGWSSAPVSPECEALRDRAMATGGYETALREFAKLHPDGDPPLASTGVMDLVHAHVLLLAGESERGRDLVRDVLRMYDAEEPGRPPNWFARHRATAYALLGDDERALAQLTASVQRRDFTHWWYTAEQDPVFAQLRKDPRFQSLASTARQHRVRQRELVDELRSQGGLPRRP